MSAMTTTIFCQLGSGCSAIPSATQQRKEHSRTKSSIGKKSTWLLRTIGEEAQRDRSEGARA